MSAAPDLLHGATAEILGLHAFFVAWFSGELREDAALHRAESAFHADFTMITPDGCLHDRAAVIERIRSARGSAAPAFQIEIEDIARVWDDKDAILVRYVEAQSSAGRHTKRRSTALFVRSDEAMNNVAWRHLQETWMQV